MDRMKRVPVREQEPEARVHNFDEVCLDTRSRVAMEEASRCLDCKNPLCVSKCPVFIKIPEFIKHVKEGDFEAAARTIAKDNALPAICGRVCPQETQCEGKCILESRESRSPSASWSALWLTGAGSTTLT